MIEYIFSHPWAGAVLKELPANPDCYYIHDVAVLPEYRGHGLGRKLAQAAIEHGKSKSLLKFMLVSVNNTEKFWNGLGFSSTGMVNYTAGVHAIKMEL